MSLDSSQDLPKAPSSSSGLSATRRGSSRGLPAAAVTLLAASGLAAQEATVTLSREVALWHDSVRVAIEGRGCSGLQDPPSVSFSDAQGAVDIDLACRQVPPSEPFSLELTLGPLSPQEYTVRVHDSIRHIVSPPPPPLATAFLTIHREANLGIKVPAPATDASPFHLVLTGPSATGCFVLEPPRVEGRVIEALYQDNCPILPPYLPSVFREEYELGPLPAGTYEVRFFDYTSVETVFPMLPALAHRELVVHPADGCVPGPTALCLQDGRFRVEVEWEDFRGRTGPGRAIPLPGRPATGLFWFFDPGNVELTVKVLEGCGRNGFWWVFLSSGSTVRYTVTVLDTSTAQSMSYTNQLGEAAALRADTTAFPCGQ